MHLIQTSTEVRRYIEELRGVSIEPICGMRRIADFASNHSF